MEKFTFPFEIASYKYAKKLLFDFATSIIIILHEIIIRTEMKIKEFVDNSFYYRGSSHSVQDCPKIFSKLHCVNHTINLHYASHLIHLV